MGQAEDPRLRARAARPADRAHDIKKLARLNCIKYVLSQIEYADKASAKDLEVDPDVVVSGIGELKMMEDNLMNPKSLPG
jgi:hypothetical protein